MCGDRLLGVRVGVISELGRMGLLGLSPPVSGDCRRL